MAYEKSESAQDNFGKLIHEFQLESKTLIMKLERIFIKTYRQNASLSFNQTCLNERVLPNYTHMHTHTHTHAHTHTHTHIYIYIYIYALTCPSTWNIYWSSQLGETSPGCDLLKLHSAFSSEVEAWWRVVNHGVPLQTRLTNLLRHLR